MYIGSIWQFYSYFSPEKFGSTCELPDKFMKEILKLGIVDFVMDWANTKSQRQVSSSKFLSFFKWGYQPYIVEAAQVDVIGLDLGYDWTLFS